MRNERLGDLVLRYDMGDGFLENVIIRLVNVVIKIINEMASSMIFFPLSANRYYSGFTRS